MYGNVTQFIGILLDPRFFKFMEIFQPIKRRKEKERSTAFLTLTMQLQNLQFSNYGIERLPTTTTLMLININLIITNFNWS